MINFPALIVCYRKSMNESQIITELPWIPPARCDARYVEGMWDDPNYVAEQKLDGSRYMLYLFMNRAAGFYSRRDFPRIEKGANVRHVARYYPGLDGTILDGEVRNPNGVFLNDTTKVMNMLPDTAARYQAKHGLFVYTVFDVLYVRGQAVYQYAYVHRRMLLERVVREMVNPYVKIIQTTGDKKKEFYNMLLARRGEGVILKHLNSPYGEGWVKRKKYVDVNVFVIDFQRGRPGVTGKYENTLGALVLGVMHEGKVVEIGECSGMTDAVRDEVWNNKSKFMYRPLDVRAQEMTSQNRLREPRFMRWRDDVSVHDCTFDHLINTIESTYGEIIKP